MQGPNTNINSRNNESFFSKDAVEKQNILLLQDMREKTSFMQPSGRDTA